jgi:hypothetical protein
MFGFRKEDLKKDGDFRGSIFDKLELSEYLCPVCEAHLKESCGELICLNACHLPKQWQMNFDKITKEMRKVSEGGEKEMKR